MYRRDQSCLVGFGIRHKGFRVRSASGILCLHVYTLPFLDSRCAPFNIDIAREHEKDYVRCIRTRPVNPMPAAASQIRNVYTCEFDRSPPGSKLANWPKAYCDLLMLE